MADQSSNIRKTQIWLKEDGLLWLINRVVFHPRGFALAYDADAQVFELWGNGDEPWSYAEVDEDELFRKAEAAMARVKR